MPVTLPELMTHLRKADINSQVAMFVDRRIVAIHEVIRVPGTPYVFLAEKPRDLMRRTFTESENGLIGFCASRNIADETIARLLGRTKTGIVRQRRKLGFADGPASIENE